jgi:hypothetical protein
MRAARRIGDLRVRLKLFLAKREFDRAFAEADAKFRAENKKRLSTRVIASARTFCLDRLAGLL